VQNNIIIQAHYAKNICINRSEHVVAWQLWEAVNDFYQKCSLLQILCICVNTMTQTHI